MTRRKKPDIKQMRLVAAPKAETVEAKLLYPNEYSCPFCLFTGYISKFLVAIEKDYSEKRMQCPDCGQKMLAKTLTLNLTPKEYADWLYQSIITSKGSGFERISWGKLTQRLKEKGIAREFWERWKQVRKPREDELYEQYQEAEGRDS